MCGTEESAHIVGKHHVASYFAATVDIVPHGAGVAVEEHRFLPVVYLHRLIQIGFAAFAAFKSGFGEEAIESGGNECSRAVGARVFRLVGIHFPSDSTIPGSLVFGSPSAPDVVVVELSGLIDVSAIAAAFPHSY